MPNKFNQDSKFANYSKKGTTKRQTNNALKLLKKKKNSK